MRKRTRYLTATVLTVALGLFTRSGLFEFPTFIIEYIGDSLWSMMVYFFFACALLSVSPWKVALYALAFSVLIETSQLYQATWINNLRANPLAALVLGHSFSWSDLLCYTVGITAALLIDLTLVQKKSNRFLVE